MGDLVVARFTNAPRNALWHNTHELVRPLTCEKIHDTSRIAPVAAAALIVGGTASVGVNDLIRPQQDDRRILIFGAVGWSR